MRVSDPRPAFKAATAAGLTLVSTRVLTSVLEAVVTNGKNSCPE